MVVRGEGEMVGSAPAWFGKPPHQNPTLYLGNPPSFTAGSFSPPLRSVRAPSSLSVSRLEVDYQTTPAAAGRQALVGLCRRETSLRERGVGGEGSALPLSSTQEGQDEQLLLSRVCYRRWPTAVVQLRSSPPSRAAVFRGNEFRGCFDRFIGRIFCF